MKMAWSSQEVGRHVVVEVEVAVVWKVKWAEWWSDPATPASCDALPPGPCELCGSLDR